MARSLAAFPLELLELVNTGRIPSLLQAFMKASEVACHQGRFTWRRCRNFGPPKWPGCLCRKAPFG